LVSVVIPNFNYAEFLGDAIDSALGLDWPAVEVIVVDDGSTDHSRAVIEGYGPRVMAIFQPNGGQIAACNTGFAHSRGEVVIFLDSDDVLDSALVQSLVDVWRPGVSKVQFQMRVIDAEGRAHGSLIPHYGALPTPEQIRHWASTAAGYPTPPGSGNAYARSFLERIFPLSGADRASDSYCLAAAPYLGDVLTVAKPMVSYRVHGRNDSAMSDLDVDRFARDFTRARGRFAYAQGIARSVGIEVPDSAFNRSLRTLPYRLASLRLAPRGHPVADDSVAQILVHAFQAFSAPQGMALPARTTLLLWLCLLGLAPQRLGKQLVLWRFASASRPRVLRYLLNALRVVKRG
jgi:glycosyltransferase involved in cell wall biosynthesis